MTKLFIICLIATLAIYMTHEASGVPAELKESEVQFGEPREKDQNEAKGLCCCCCGYCLYCNRNGADGMQFQAEKMNELSPVKFLGNQTMDEHESKGTCCCCCGWCLSCGYDGLPALHSI